MGILKLLLGYIQTPYEDLPTFQSLVTERFAIGAAEKKIINKYYNFEKDAVGLITDPNDLKLFDALNERDSNICQHIICSIKGKLTYKNCNWTEGIGKGDFLCRIEVEISPSHPEIPSDLSFYISLKRNGERQIEFLRKMELGQTIKLRGGFDGSSTRVLNPDVVVPNR